MESLERTAATLIELDEPEALLGTLQRACAAKARAYGEGRVTLGEAKRWDRLARALERVGDDLGLIAKADTEKAAHELPKANEGLSEGEQPSVVA